MLNQKLLSQSKLIDFLCNFFKYLIVTKERTKLLLRKSNTERDSYESINARGMFIAVIFVIS